MQKIFHQSPPLLHGSFTPFFSLTSRETSHQSSPPLRERFFVFLLPRFVGDFLSILFPRFAEEFPPNSSPASQKISHQSSPPLREGLSVDPLPPLRRKISSKLLPTSREISRQSPPPLRGGFSLNLLPREAGED